MNDEWLERYSRQLLVPGIDFQGQEALAAATVVLVGCGGLGCPLAMYLAAAGVGQLRLIDNDRIELSNLPRQIAFTEDDVGHFKATQLAERLRAMNREVQVSAMTHRLSVNNAAELLAGATLVIDASDSRETRVVIEDATRVASQPWLMGAAIQWSGQWIAFSANRREGCYRCLAPSKDDVAAGGCARLGVIGPVVGATAMMQATAAINYLSGGDTSWGQLYLYDFRRGEQQILALHPRANCPACRIN